MEPNPLVDVLVDGLLLDKARRELHERESLLGRMVHVIRAQGRREKWRVPAHVRSRDLAEWLYIAHGADWSGDFCRTLERETIASRPPKSGASSKG